MKKVMNIRLGNYVLTIDDDAAGIVSNYSEALRRRYASEEGAQEIVSDIEERMGELLDKKQKENNRNYTTLEDVNAVIEQMGPLDAGTETSGDFQNQEIRRRLYRDPENRILGGVWGGIAAYFDIDPVILRVAWVLSIFLLGFGIPLYIILWVVIPEARTTAEKLMMRGQRPTLKNIEENVKSELNDVSDRLANPKTHDRISYFLRTLVEYFTRFVTVVARFAFSMVGMVLLMVLIAVLIAVSTNQIYFHTYHLVLNGQEGLNTVLSSAGDPFWIKITAVVFILLMISWIGLFVFSNRRNRESIRMPRRYLGWASTVALLILFVFAFDGARNVGTRSDRRAYSEVLNISGDTLEILAPVIDTDIHGLYTLNHFEDIRVSPDDKFHIEQQNTTFGHNRISSAVRNEHMPKMYTLNSNSLTLLQGKKVTDMRKGDFGWVKYILYVPVGKTVKSGSGFHFFENNHTPLSGKNQQFTMDSTGNFSGVMGNSGGINLGDNIESLEINGKFDVQIIPSKVNRIELVSGPITMHRDWISHNGSDLSIEEEDDYWFNEKPSYIRIYLNHLNRLEIGSISQVSLKNWKGSNLYISADGASRIDGSLEVNELNLEMDGTAQSEMSGKLSFLQIETDGAADFDGKMLEASNVNAQTDGASQIDVWATANIDGEATGASSITLKGQPLNANIKTSGAARYKKL